MGIPPAREVTRLLLAWRQGDRAALDYLLPHVYRELHAIAARQMRRERPGTTLQTTALVREAYLRLVDSTCVDADNRAHFLAIAARQMRRILVDSARARGGGTRVVSTEILDDALLVSREPQTDLVALDAALQALEQVDSRRARILELRWFGGLTVEETAQALDVPPETVERESVAARTWVCDQLRGDAGLSPEES